MKTDAKKLTPNALKKYKKIINEWFNNDFNGKQAYLKFYKNVKDATASTNFSKLSNFPEIKEYIQEKHEEAAKFVKMTHEGILQELKNYIESDITQTIALEPEEVKELPIEVRRLITKYKTTSRNIYNSKGDVIEKVNTVELHFISKERALEMVNKHIGFYEVDNKQKASVVNISVANDKHKGIVEGILNGEN